VPLIHTEIEIAAPASRVWALLSDFAGYPKWNPSIARLEGRAEPGARLRLGARLAGVITVPLRPVLLTFDPDRELAWSGGMTLLMAGAHRFAIQQVTADRVLLIHDENFTGWLAPIFALLFARGLRFAYQQANCNLKALAEQRSGAKGAP
jgi:hypothetical protein